MFTFSRLTCIFLPSGELKQCIFHFLFHTFLIQTTLRSPVFAISMNLEGLLHGFQQNFVNIFQSFSLGNLSFSDTSYLNIVLAKQFSIATNEIVFVSSLELLAIFWIKIKNRVNLTFTREVTDFTRILLEAPALLAFESIDK